MTFGKHRVWVLSFGFWVNGLSSLGDLGAFQFDPLCAPAVLWFWVLAFWHLDGLGLRGVRVLGFGFWVLEFMGVGFWDFGFWGLGSWVLGFGGYGYQSFRVSGVWYFVISGFWGLGFGIRSIVVCY